jgi:hypothetical protein
MSEQPGTVATEAPKKRNRLGLLLAMAMFVWSSIRP